MKRIEFVKSLVGIYGLANISNLEIKQYKKVYLKQFFVRGFQYYEGPNCFEDINKSGLIELIREPANEFDNKAIALHFDKKKIGYVPRESNKTISILMDTELLEFHAEITQIEPEASHWEQIQVAIYALKEIKNNDDWKKIEPFAALKTKKYHSLKSEDDTLTRIDFEEDEYDETDFGFFPERRVQKTLQSKQTDAQISVIYYNHYEDEIMNLVTKNNCHPDLKLFLNKSTTHPNEEILMQKLLAYCDNLNDYITTDKVFAIDIEKLFDHNYEMAGFDHHIGENGLPYFNVLFNPSEKNL